MSNLLEDFFDIKYWKEAIDKSVGKQMNPYMLRKFCTAEGRARLLEEIVSGEYRIKPPRVQKIEKDDGGFREIYVNTGKTD